MKNNYRTEKYKILSIQSNTETTKNDKNENKKNTNF